MLQLEAQHQKIVQAILCKYPYRFYVYGSRAQGTARKLSDLDLCYYDDIPDAVVFQIAAEFQESDLPFLVELVAWKDMKPDFQKIISQDLVPLVF